MIKKPVEDSINSQIVKEMYSSNLYLSMSAWFHARNLNGFANWMRVQAQEELAHANKFFDYLVERGGTAIIGAIDAPPIGWKSPLEAFEQTLAHELTVTDSINEMAEVAIKEKDHATQIFLQWFISEQVEEEANASDLVERVRMANDNPSAIFFLDNELKARVFTPIAPNAQA